MNGQRFSGTTAYFPKYPGLSDEARKALFAKDREIRRLTARLHAAETTLDYFADLAAGKLGTLDLDWLVARLSESLAAHGFEPGVRRTIRDYPGMTDVLENLVTVHDIAQRRKVADRTALNWALHSKGFPEPVAGSRKMAYAAVWWWPDVHAFLVRVGLAPLPGGAGPAKRRRRTMPSASGAQLDNANTRRSREAAARTIEHVTRALAAANGDIPEKLVTAGRLRVQFPDATIAELGERAGISKDMMASRLRRLLSYAPEDGGNDA